MTGPDHHGAPPGGWPPGAPLSGPAAPAPARSRAVLEPAKAFGVVIAALGALNFVFGFLPELTSSRIDATLSVYAVGPAYVPILLLVAGLLALAAFIPGSERSRLAVAAVSVGGAVGALISLGTDGPVQALTSAQVSKGMGAVLLTIFGIIQAVVAIAAFVVGADARFAPRTAGQPPAAVGGRASSDPDTGPIRPVSFPAPAGPAAAPWAQPGSSERGAPPPVAYYAGWAPPPDDDRPTGPQRAVDPATVQPDERQGPAERELPRVVPGRRDDAVPTGSTEQSTNQPDQDGPG